MKLWWPQEDRGNRTLNSFDIDIFGTDSRSSDDTNYVSILDNVKGSSCDESVTSDAPLISHATKLMEGRNIGLLLRSEKFQIHVTDPRYNAALSSHNVTNERAVASRL